MALFKSGNPTLTQKIFDHASTQEAAVQGTMSARGAMNKFGFMLLMLMGGAAYTWHLYGSGAPDTMRMWMFIGLFGGLISAIAISFKPVWAPYLAPLYGLLEGLFIGGISAVINDAFKEKYPGLIMQAVGLTFGVAIAMFLLYNFRVIRATQRFKSVIFTAVLGIGFFYLITIVMGMFGVSIPFMYDSSALGIGISLFITGIAALSLIVDFDLIEQGAAQGAPKYMEWYGGFALMVTMVWLYLNILTLLMRLGNRN
jgi:uncharacterized YccA/Bax inhibitor family protein